MPGVQAHRVVSDKWALTAAVARHHAVTVTVGEAHHFKGLADRANLVDLEQHGVARPGLDPVLDPFRVGREQVISDDLNVEFLRHDGVPFIIVFVQRVLQDDKGIIGLHLLVQRDQIVSGLVRF